MKLRGTVGAPVSLVLTAFVALMAGTIAGKQVRSDAVGWAVAAATIAIGLYVTWRLASRRMVVGDDGVRLVRAPTTRFVRYADIVGVSGARLRIGHPQPGQPDLPSMFIPGVRLELAQRESVEIPLVGVPEATIATIVARVEAGIALARSAGARPTLDRAGRSVSAWRDALQKQVQSADFRSKSRTVEELDAVLADPTSRAEDRVGAALALRAAGAEGADERIRIAAAATANPRLRIALDATAEDALDDETLDAAARAEAEA